MDASLTVGFSEVPYDSLSLVLANSTVALYLQLTLALERIEYGGEEVKEMMYARMGRLHVSHNISVRMRWNSIRK